MNRVYRRAFVAFFLLFAFALCFIILAPAELMQVVLQRASNGRYALDAVRGSFWQGQGSLYWQGSDAQMRLAGVARWQFNLTTPLELEYQLNLNGGTALITLSITGTNYVVQQLRLPPAMVVAMLPLPLPSQGWLGDVNIVQGSGQCSWAGVCLGQTEMSWQGAGVSIVSPEPLGDYQLVWRQLEARQPTTLTWRSGQGPLYVHADAVLSQGKSSWRGTAWVESGHPQQTRIESFLSSLGNKNSLDQRYHIQYQQP